MLGSGETEGEACGERRDRLGRLWIEMQSLHPSLNQPGLPNTPTQRNASGEITYSGMRQLALLHGVRV